jgi:hypothetical protein
VLERIEKCQTLIFGKTGTLTYGRPNLTEIICAKGFTRAEVLRFCRQPGTVFEAPAGQRSGHGGKAGEDRNALGREDSRKGQRRIERKNRRQANRDNRSQELIDLLAVLNAGCASRCQGTICWISDCLKSISESSEMSAQETPALRRFTVVSPDGAQEEERQAWTRY